MTGRVRLGQENNSKVKEWERLMDEGGRRQSFGNNKAFYEKK